MKKIISFLTVFAAFITYSQNNFPSAGQVTIGTNSSTSSALVDINGNVEIDSSVIIRDSLVVSNRIRAKGELVVTGKTVLKDDAVVKLNFRTNGN